MASALTTLMVLSAANAAELTIIKEGRAKLTLVSGSVHPPVIELQKYLQQISGAELKIIPANKGAEGVCVGLVADFHWLELGDVAKLGDDGFVMKTQGDSLYLVANKPRGVQHAVTTFLHRLGCRWFFPGEAWEVVPQTRTISGAWNERHAPSYSTQRRIWPGYGAYSQNRRDWDQWNRHNRMGEAFPIKIHHTFYGLKPQGDDFQRHPEWFALVDGRRQPTKPCYSHPKVVQRATENALRQAATGTGMITLSAPDGLGFCECPRCVAPLKGTAPFSIARLDNAVTENALEIADRQFQIPGKGYDLAQFGIRADKTIVCATSDTLFRFVNLVATAVRKEYPEARIGCYAYSAYSHPPSFALHPNVYVQITTSYRRTPLTLQRQLELWSERTKLLGIREYYSVYQWDWDGPDPGQVRPDRLRDTLRFFHRNGVTAINAEASNNWGPRGLGYYIASQLLWNVDADVEKLTEDFYQNAFGPAAEPMKRYYVRWYGKAGNFKTSGDQKVDDPPHLTIDTLRASYRDLDDAATLARDNPQVVRRIDQLRMYGHFLLMRLQLEQATKRGDKRGILAAIEGETVFGGRINDTNMVHARPLVGKAFLRRFVKYKELLTKLPPSLQEGKPWRHIGVPPTHAELERIWAADKNTLQIE